MAFNCQFALVSDSFSLMTLISKSVNCACFTWRLIKMSKQIKMSMEKLSKIVEGNFAAQGAKGKKESARNK